MSSLTVTTTSESEGIYTISPVGSIDSETSIILEKEVDKLRGKSPKELTFNMDGVNYISSMGVRVVIIAKKMMKQNNGKMTLSNFQPSVKKVFEVINACTSDFDNL